MLKHLVIVVGLSLAACSSVADRAPTTIAAAEKSLTIAHLAYNGIGSSLKTAADTGLLRGMPAAMAKVWYDKAGDALLVADRADDAANAQGILDALVIAQDAIAKADALAKGKP